MLILWQFFANFKQIATAYNYFSHTGGGQYPGVYLKIDIYRD